MEPTGLKRSRSASDADCFCPVGDPGSV